MVFLMKASEAAFPLPIQTWVSFDRTGYAGIGNTKISLASCRKTVIERFSTECQSNQNQTIATKRTNQNSKQTHANDVRRRQIGIGDF